MIGTAVVQVACQGCEKTWNYSCGRLLFVVPPFGGGLSEMCCTGEDRFEKGDTPSSLALRASTLSLLATAGVMIKAEFSGVSFRLKAVATLTK